MPVIEEEIVVGNVHDFTLVATKSGAIWDLTGTTVTFYLTSPTGVTTTHAATLSDPAAGMAVWRCAASTLNVASDDWKRAWKIVDGGVVQSSRFRRFTVYDFA